jgi:hypothetical protein
MRNRGRCPARPRNLFLVYSAQTGSGVHPASFSVYSGVLSAAVKRPSSTEIKKAWSSVSILTCLHGAVRGRNVPFTYPLDNRTGRVITLINSATGHNHEPRRPPSISTTCPPTVPLSRYWLSTFRYTPEMLLPS